MKKDIVEGNVYIIDFIKLKFDKAYRGWVLVPKKYHKVYGTSFSIIFSEFHTSLGWLEPAVKKIESLGFNYSLSTHISYKEDNPKPTYNYVVTIGDNNTNCSYVPIVVNSKHLKKNITKEYCVWLAIVKFIKGYNEKILVK